MSLSAFIKRNLELLLEEWERHARAAQPDHADLNREELRDWASGLLSAMAEEIVEQRGHGERRQDAPSMTEAAEAHAMERLAQGFNLDQMISEYAAMRTSVAQLWIRESDADAAALGELVRFDRALDDALRISARQYTAVLERARDLFLGALGHDMRTPLGSILATSEALLLAPEKLASEHLQGAVRVRNAAKRLRKMLDDLFDFTRTRLGAPLPIARQPTDLRDVCGQVAEEVRASHPSCTIEVACDGELTGSFDPDRVGRMLSNLVTNAVQYGYPGTSARVEARGEPDCTFLTVRNQGEPIPKEAQRTIFEPLVSGGLKQQRGSGLGLGLYIARAVAESHGGGITMSSTREGTIFEARLPRR